MGSIQSSNFQTFTPVFSGLPAPAPNLYSAATTQDLAAVTTSGFCNYEIDRGWLFPNDLLLIKYLSGQMGETTQYFIMDADGETLGVFGDGTGSVTSVGGTGGIVATPSPITGAGTLSLATIATLTILSNMTGSTALPTANTLSGIIDASMGSDEGDILYRSNSGWVVLPAGTNGQVLSTGGSSAAPSWEDAGGLPTIGVNEILMNATASPAMPTGVTLFNAFYAGVSNTQGALWYCDSASWQALAPAAAGQVLICGGAGSNPEWSNLFVTGSTVSIGANNPGATMSYNVLNTGTSADSDAAINVQVTSDMTGAQGGSAYTSYQQLNYQTVNAGVWSQGNGGDNAYHISFGPFSANDPFKCEASGVTINNGLNLNSTAPLYGDLFNFDIILGSPATYTLSASDVGNFTVFSDTPSLVAPLGLPSQSKYFIFNANGATGPVTLSGDSGVLVTGPNVINQGDLFLEVNYNLSPSSSQILSFPLYRKNSPQSIYPTNNSLLGWNSSGNCENKSYRKGQATLVNGTVVVSCDAVSSASLIVVTNAGIGTTGANPIGILSVDSSSIVTNTSFTVNSLSPTLGNTLVTTDQSLFNYYVFNDT